MERNYNTIGEIGEMMDDVKGFARKRTLGITELKDCIDCAKKTGWSWQCGGWVANAYKYPAIMMRLTVIRIDNDYAVCFDWGSASKGHSPLPEKLPRQGNYANEKFGKILVEFVREHPDTVNAWIKEDK